MSSERVTCLRVRTKRKIIEKSSQRAKRRCAKIFFSKATLGVSLTFEVLSSSQKPDIERFVCRKSAENISAPFSGPSVTWIQWINPSDCDKSVRNSLSFSVERRKIAKKKSFSQWFIEKNSLKKFSVLGLKANVISATNRTLALNTLFSAPVD